MPMLCEAPALAISWRLHSRVLPVLHKEPQPHKSPHALTHLDTCVLLHYLLCHKSGLQLLSIPKGTSVTASDAAATSVTASDTAATSVTASDTAATASDGMYLLDPAGGNQLAQSYMHASAPIQTPFNSSAFLPYAGSQHCLHGWGHGPAVAPQLGLSLAHNLAALAAA